MRVVSRWFCCQGWYETEANSEAAFTSPPIEKDLSNFSREDRHLLIDLFPPDGPVYWRADVL
ncbi:MAG: hypothetical protein ACTSX8_10075, partial [Alphaproteobacteria bacterium]